MAQYREGVHAPRRAARCDAVGDHADLEFADARIECRGQHTGFGRDAGDQHARDVARLEQVMQRGLVERRMARLEHMRIVGVRRDRFEHRAPG